MFSIFDQEKKIWILYLFRFVCYILLNTQTPIINHTFENIFSAWTMNK